MGKLIRTLLSAGLIALFAFTAQSQTSSPADSPTPDQNPSSQSVQDRYILRPGDKLELQYRLTKDLNEVVTVQPDGFVSLNIAGDVHVGGMTVAQAHDAILVKESERLNNPELNLILVEFTPSSVIVAGEVNKPGRIPLKEGTTALYAIMQTGGLSDSAKSGQILLYRKVNNEFAEVHQLNFSKLKKQTTLDHDMVLQPGDTIFVPRDRITVVKHFTSLLNVSATINPTNVAR
jgi:polysaccharide biosynthesis/export protein